MTDIGEDWIFRFWGRGLHHASDLLIRRGTAMGPLVPWLLLSPVFLFAAWILRDLPILAFSCLIVAIGILIEYSRQFAKFAKNDPDRLQSEEYRYEMRRIQLIAAKELPAPMSANTLNLPPPTSNPTQPELPPLRERGDTTREPLK